MNHHRLTSLNRSLTRIPSRRDLLRGLVGAGFGWGIARLPENLAARKGKGKDKPRARKGLCARDGSECRKPGKTCKTRFCLRAPFTIEAVWTQSADHQAHLFFPQYGPAGPFPYMPSNCTPNNSDCEEQYPFACFDGDEKVSGDEVATLHRLLPGTYEFWIEIDGATPAGELTVLLKDTGGRIVRRWQNPAIAAQAKVAWHVFDVDGGHGRVTSVDALNAEPAPLPMAAHDPSDHYCPGD